MAAPDGRHLSSRRQTFVCSAEDHHRLERANHLRMMELWNAGAAASRVGFLL